MNTVDNADRAAIRLLVAAGFITQAKANEALNIAHGFVKGPLSAPAPQEGVDEALRIAYNHLDMTALRVSHGKDAAKIEAALAAGALPQSRAVIAEALRLLDNVTAAQDSEADCLGQAENLLRGLLAAAPAPPAPPPAQAHTLLLEAAAAIGARAALRDCPDGERSMARTVAAFNALFGTALTETQGWHFMEVLKLARASAGGHHLDDHTDRAAYAALAGESAEREARR